MSLMDVLKREAIVTCPYDPSHRIVAKKLTTHLVKCKRNHMKHDDKYMECPYNHTHRILAIEKSYHLAECPDRAAIERQVLVGNTRDPGVKANGTKADGQPLDEDWDNDMAFVYSPPYNPRKKMVSMEIRNASTLCSMAPSERRTYYKDLLEKHANGYEEKKDDELEVSPALEFQPLRQPKTKSYLETASRCGSTDSKYGGDRESMRSFAGSTDGRYGGGRESMRSYAGSTTSSIRSTSPSGFRNFDMITISKGRGISRRSASDVTSCFTVGTTGASGYQSSVSTRYPDYASVAGSFVSSDLPICNHNYSSSCSS